jgi:TonB family protein
MASISLADQLEDAMELMIAEPDSAPPKVDLKIGELLGIAAELRLLPDPEFRVALNAELVGRHHTVPVAGHLDISLQASQSRQAWRDATPGEILPTLFGAGDGTYPVHRGNFAISAVIHAGLIAVAATAGLWMTKPAQLTSHKTSVVLTDISAYALPPSIDKSGGGGGGTVVGPPALSVPPTSQIGNPLSAIVQPASNGTGSGSGIGSGSGGGIGAGEGPGFGPGYGGGTGGGLFRVGGGVSAPRPIYDPDPEYSEEARHAKYQGTVLLWVIVGPDGRPHDIRVQRSLGMGLDEKAIEAVRQWKFEPSMKDGHPVAVQVNVEVSFRLY